MCLTDDGFPDLEELAATVKGNPDYRVLRRLRPWAPITGFDDRETRIGLLVDVETTGLDAEKDEIIELAMVPFRYALDGTVVEILDPFDRLREPSKPISPEITALTGVTDEMVAGKVIKPSDVSSFAGGAALVIAHNAAFDRRSWNASAWYSQRRRSLVPYLRSIGQPKG